MNKIKSLNQSDRFIIYELNSKNKRKLISSWTKSLKTVLSKYDNFFEEYNFKKSFNNDSYGNPTFYYNTNSNSIKCTISFSVVFHNNSHTLFVFQIFEGGQPSGSGEILNFISNKVIPKSIDTLIHAGINRLSFVSPESYSYI